MRLQCAQMGRMSLCPFGVMTGTALDRCHYAPSARCHCVPWRVGLFADWVDGIHGRGDQGGQRAAQGRRLHTVGQVRCTMYGLRCTDAVNKVVGVACPVDTPQAWMDRLCPQVRANKRQSDLTSTALRLGGEMCRNIIIMVSLRWQCLGRPTCHLQVRYGTPLRMLRTRHHSVQRSFSAAKCSPKRTKLSRSVESRQSTGKFRPYSGIKDVPSILLLSTANPPVGWGIEIMMSDSEATVRRPLQVEVATSTRSESPAGAARGPGRRAAAPRRRAAVTAWGAQRRGGRRGLCTSAAAGAAPPSSPAT